MSYLRYLCLLSAYWCQTHIALCFCFVFLRLVYLMLSVSLDCPILITPWLFSNLYLLECPLIIQKAICIPTTGLPCKLMRFRLDVY